MCQRTILTNADLALSIASIRVRSTRRSGTPTATPSTRWSSTRRSCRRRSTRRSRARRRSTSSSPSRASSAYWPPGARLASSPTRRSFGERAARCSPTPTTSGTTNRSSTAGSRAAGRREGHRPIAYHTSPGELVYEPFCGSGTALIAAEQTGRVCHALEQSPVFCDVAVARFEAFTGVKAVRHG